MVVLSQGEKLITLPAHSIVGRSPACEFVVPDRTVSAQHAVLQWNGTEWEIRDFGSRNGTFLDGVRLPLGRGSVLSLGSRIQFGRASPMWEVVGIDAPVPLAASLQTGERRAALGGYLVLPDPNAPEYCIYQDRLGAWVAEHCGEMEVLEDRAVITCENGTCWRVHLPVSVPGTLSAEDGLPLVSRMRLQFRVSRDEEHVEIVGFCGGRNFDLPFRAHHYLLLVLARQRQSDELASLSESEQGWMDRDELARMLRMSPAHIDTSIHRARSQLARLGVSDAASLVERRPGSRSLRIGVQCLEIVPL